MSRQTGRRPRGTKQIVSRSRGMKKSTSIIISGLLFTLAAAGVGMGAYSLIKDDEAVQGIQGPKGDTGAAGAKGDTGAAGAKGDTGAVGAKGDTGAAGAKGDTGAAGAKGDTGAVGAKGDTGAVGAKGDTGAVGAKGDTGAVGAKGDTGAVGAKGDTGAAGTNGNDGQDGAKGDKGNSGVTEGGYWKITRELDPVDSTRQIKTLRIKENATTEAHIDDAYAEIIDEGVSLEKVNELLLPYHLNSPSIEATAKQKLHLDDAQIPPAQFGFVFNKSDYDSRNVYRNQNIVEVTLPKTVTSISGDQFRDNKIRKVNWSELTKLKTIGTASFYNNRLNGELDLSNLTSLETISQYSFARNYLSGTLTLSPVIVRIQQYAFNHSAHNGLGDQFGNNISGTLKLPSSLIVIGKEAFIANQIEVLDWSEASSLSGIGTESFKNNKIKTLDFTVGVLPKLLTLGTRAFAGNTGQNADGEMITSDFTVPPILNIWDTGAVKVSSGLTITITTNQTGINQSSFSPAAIVLNRVAPTP